MSKLTYYTALTLMALTVALGSGCGKSGVDRKVLEGTAKLPGTADVMAAIDKKDYEGAVAALMKVRESATSDEQIVYLRVLTRQAKDKMLDAAATNAAAAQAVMTLRMMATGGR
jgi:hypothetical protein